MRQFNVDKRWKDSKSIEIVAQLAAGLLSSQRLSAAAAALAVLRSCNANCHRKSLLGHVRCFRRGETHQEDVQRSVEAPVRASSCQVPAASLHSVACSQGSRFPRRLLFCGQNPNCARGIDVILNIMLEDFDTRKRELESSASG